MRLVALVLASCVGLDPVPIPAGSVYVCATDPTTEWCWDGARARLESDLGAACWPTTRHLGPCLYSCEPDSRGCNATSGCWCSDGDS